MSFIAFTFVFDKLELEFLEEMEFLFLSYHFFIACVINQDKYFELAKLVEGGRKELMLP